MSSALTSPKTWGVAVDEFLTDVVAHIVEIERTVFTLDLRMEHYLEKQVAKLLAKHFGAVLVDALAHFICFLYEVCADTFMGLYLVPGAAVF